jgi:ubiquinone/menaquinone biosynthesis C-methylase UbiE
MLIRLAMKLTELSPRFKRFLWRRWYQYLAGYQLREWRFMNYGFAPPDDEQPLALQPADETNRSSIQLYHHVASAVPLAGLEVLEVGCGRGGGASYVKRYLRPGQMTGVDFSAKAIRFCQANHHVEGLSFVQGDAESLPFEDKSFDAVLNVESSHCYGSMPAFVRQFERVLRPGGHFLFADLRMATDRNRLHEQLLASGLTLIDREDITPGVLAALRGDSERKLALIEKSVPKRLLPAFRQFAAVEGSETYEAFRSGAMVYVRYVMGK